MMICIVKWPVINAPPSGDKPWDLGTYMEQIGGVSARRKKQLESIYIPFVDFEDEEVRVK